MGLKSLCTLSNVIWNLLIKHNITPMMTHLTETFNNMAEALSGMENMVITHIERPNICIFQSTIHHLGHPFVDPFPTCQNIKC